MPVDHTGTTRPRCVVLSDEDVAVIRRVGNGNQSQGIRELVRMYLDITEWQKEDRNEH